MRLSIVVMIQFQYREDNHWRGVGIVSHRALLDVEKWLMFQSNSWNTYQFGAGTDILQHCLLISRTTNDALHDELHSHTIGTQLVVDKVLANTIRFDNIALNQCVRCIFRTHFTVTSFIPHSVNLNAHG